MMNAMMRSKKSTHNENEPRFLHLITPPAILAWHPKHLLHNILSSKLVIISRQIGQYQRNAHFSVHYFQSYFIFRWPEIAMRRLQILSPLLLIWLVLVALQQHYASSSSFQETGSVSFKVSTAAYNSRKTGGNIQRDWRNTKEATEKKVRKTPSGPSPVGNNRPPSKA